MTKLIEIIINNIPQTHRPPTHSLINQKAINKEVINLSLNSLALDISIDISQSSGKEEGGFKDSMMMKFLIIKKMML